MVTHPSWAAAAAAPPPPPPPPPAASVSVSVSASVSASASTGSSTSGERPPVGLRPVTQQQLEARHFRRTASAPPEAAIFRTASSNNSTRGGARGAAASAVASDDDTGDDGWKNVASKSRWNRSHRRAGLLPPSRAAAETPPPPAGAPYYSWATTAVVSAAAVANAPSASATVAVGMRTAVVGPPREESARALSLKQSQTARVGGSLKRDYGRRSAAVITQRSRTLEQSVRMPHNAKTMDGKGMGVRRSTSLQKLLAKLEFEGDEGEQQYQQYQHSARRRNDQSAGAAVGSQEQLKTSATEPSKPTPAVAAPAAASQKCGDKRDFFFRNLEFEMRNRLQIDDVAGFSVTEHEMATKISEAIVALFEALPCDEHTPSRGQRQRQRQSSLVVTDATACIGGNVISFCDYFAIVNAVECDRTRCEMLQHNLAVLGKRNALCVHASYLLVMHDLQQDVVFIDPPWGGPEYKDLAYVDLFLDDVPLYDICRQLHGRAKVVVLKVPTNFDADKFAQHVPGKVDVRKDFHKMHLVVIDYREPRSCDQAVSASSEQSLLPS